MPEVEKCPKNISYTVGNVGEFDNRELPCHGYAVMTSLNADDEKGKTFPRFWIIAMNRCEKASTQSFQNASETC